MPQLTIVVPVYNAAPYLKQCVQSILAQQFADFTLLLMDDGSTDASPALCDAFAASDARVQVLHQENQGVEQTILQGIRLASTPYIGFVDSDDWLLPEMYQVLLGAMQVQNADLAQCGALRNGTTRSDALSSSADVVLTNLIDTIYRPFFETTADLAPLTNARWSKVYRTDLLQQTIADGLPQGVSIGEDLLLNLAYLRHCKKAIALAGSDYYCYRSNAASLSVLYTEKKKQSMLRLYSLLSRLAKQNNFTDEAVARQGKNETCSLMLDALLSTLPIREKAAQVRALHAALTDKPHLLHYAAQRPLVARLALYLVHLHLYGLVSTLVSAMLCITKKKETV